MQRNIDAMNARAKRHGVALRPHAKTAKCAEISRLMTAGHSGAIAVSTLAEAEALAAAGFDDILYAVGIAPHKLDRVAALHAAGCDVAVLCDSVAAVTALQAHPAAVGIGANKPLRVFIEVDCGYGRAGLLPDDATLVDVADFLVGTDHLRFAGLLTHGGHSYACRSVDGVADVAEEERTSIVAAANLLRRSGHGVSLVSAGSTPTAVHGASWLGVDELRPGNYVFFDLTQSLIGSCTIDDIAVSVLATVIGHREDQGTATIDAGSLALSPDGGAHAVYGYGIVCDVAGEPIPGVTVGSLSQEHGWLVAATDRGLFSEGRKVPYDRLPIGSQVRILPSHSCITSAMFDVYHVLDDRHVNETWPRIRGW